MIVAPVTESPGRARAEQLFAPLGKAFMELTASYSDEQLRIVLEFVNRASDMLRDQTTGVLRASAADTT